MKKNKFIEMQSKDENGDRFQIMLNKKSLKADQNIAAKADEIYEIIITNVPAGVYKKLFTKMVKEDSTTNNYLERDLGYGKNSK